MYSAKVLADSVAINRSGVRLTTLEVTMPRIVLAEFNTHRMLSRNSASSRAIPVEKMLERVKNNPFIPDSWPANGKGMQPAGNLDESTAAFSKEEWLRARDNVVQSVENMLALGVHKQITNRLLEPWLWHTVIVTATDWENFFALRLHKDAQEQLRKTAQAMKEALSQSEPTIKPLHAWHRPLCSDEHELLEAGYGEEEINLISIGRCARVSYLTHDGKRDPDADIALAYKLEKSGHMSPFEHVAYARSDHHARCGNFRGWKQYRKTIPGEEVFRPE